MCAPTKSKWNPFIARSHPSLFSAATHNGRESCSAQYCVPYALLWCGYAGNFRFRVGGRVETLARITPTVVSSPVSPAPNFDMDTGVNLDMAYGAGRGSTGTERCVLRERVCTCYSDCRLVRCEACSAAKPMM